jgi:hypothetical protein
MFISNNSLVYSFKQPQQSQAPSRVGFGSIQFTGPGKEKGKETSAEDTATVATSGKLSVRFTKLLSAAFNKLMPPGKQNEMKTVKEAVAGFQQYVDNDIQNSLNKINPPDFEQRDHDPYGDISLQHTINVLRQAWNYAKEQSTEPKQAKKAMKRYKAIEKGVERYYIKEKAKERTEENKQKYPGLEQWISGLPSKSPYEISSPRQSREYKDTLRAVSQSHPDLRSLQTEFTTSSSAPPLPEQSQKKKGGTLYSIPSSLDTSLSSQQGPSTAANVANETSGFYPSSSSSASTQTGKLRKSKK